MSNFYSFRITAAADRASMKREQREANAATIRNIKAMKRTLAEQEKAVDTEFLDPAHPTRQAAIAHIASLIEAEGADQPSSDVVAERLEDSQPQLALSMVNPDYDGVLRRNPTFSDETACSFVVRTPTEIEVPYHAVEDVFVSKDATLVGEVVVSVGERTYKRVVVCRPIRSSLACDSLTLDVGEQLQGIPFTHPTPGRFSGYHVYACVPLKVGVDHVWLKHIGDGWYSSPQPARTLISPGFSGIGAIVDGKCVARLYGGTADGSVLIWAPLQKDEEAMLMRFYALAEQIDLIQFSKNSSVEPFARTRRAPMYSLEEYSGMSGKQKFLLRQDARTYSGYDYEWDVSSYADVSDDGDVVYNSRFGFNPDAYDDDFGVQADRSEKIRKGLVVTFDDYRGKGSSKVERYSKKKKHVQPESSKVAELTSSLSADVAAIQTVLQEPPAAAPDSVPPVVVSTNPFDDYDETSGNPFDGVVDPQHFAEFPAVKPAQPDPPAPRKIAVPQIDAFDPDVIAKAKEAKLAHEINTFNEEIAKHQANGVTLNTVVTLSEIERQTLRGSHILKRLAEKTAKAYRDRAKFDEMMKARAENEHKKTLKVQKSVNALTQQLANLQAKLAADSQKKDF